MDASTIRATCPACQSTLRIPAAYAGQVVKCKKCGSAMRVAAPEEAPPESPAAEPTVQDDFALQGANDFSGLSRSRGSRENPFDSGSEEQPSPLPGYQPPAPGYYPGYPYPMPPAGYGPPPGYPYPMPPAGYGPPPGYEAAPPPYQPPTPAAFEPPPYQPPAPPPPVQTLPAVPAGPSAAAQAMSGFKPSEATASQSRRRSGYRRGPDRGKYIWIGVALLLTGGLVVGGILGAKQVKKSTKPTENEQANNGGGDPKGGSNPGAGGTKPNPLASSGAFPRRLLFIHISNYLYLNPLTHAQVEGKSVGQDRTRPDATRMATEWRVPNDQIFLLSDTAAGNDHRLPMREVLTGTYEKFFETSRNQDRIIVYFGGHALSKDGKTYLVPIEGDPDEVERLVPLEDFYAKMKACKATQKVVIWDVARYNPERGRNRPGSEPLAEETATALATPPAGVQAILTCQAGENALEFYNAQPDGFGPNKPPVIGSNFLSAVRSVSDKNRNNSKQQNPDDAIPVDAWATAVGQRVSEVVAAEGKGKQTVKVAGAAPSSLVAFNKEEAPAAKFEFPPSPKSASPAEVGAIASELGLPSIKKDDGSSGIADFPFPAESLAPYKADVSLEEIKKDKNKYAFRNAVIDGFDTIRDVWTGSGEMQLREELKEKSSDNLKKRVLDEQKFPALGIAKLERAIVILESVQGMRESEPKRWQAHYDYALAQCKARVSWLHEYNLALGNIRTEVLPPLDEKKGQDGYRLQASEKMKVKSEAKRAEEAKELYAKIMEDYKGSPWAILAKRDRTVSLGLQWVPATFGTIEPTAAATPP